MVSAAGPAEAGVSTVRTESDVAGPCVPPAEGVEAVLLQLEEGEAHAGLAGWTDWILHPLAPPHVAPQLDPSLGRQHLTPASSTPAQRSCSRLTDSHKDTDQGTKALQGHFLHFDVSV